MRVCVQMCVRAFVRVCVYVNANNGYVCSAGHRLAVPGSRGTSHHDRDG